MSYANLDYLIEWFGENELRNISQRPNAANNNPREVNQAVVLEALRLAQEEIDSALGARYVLPVTLADEDMPGVLRECHAWLAWCRLMAHSPRQADKPHPECQRWRKWLGQVQDQQTDIPQLAERLTQNVTIHVSQADSRFDWERF